MAPRGGSKKVGLKRIDAAVDALRPLGFSKDVICKTVNALLKVYEGNEGWVFIEEASYRLLIETILEEQDKALAAKDDSRKNDARELESSEPLAAVESANEVIGVTETTVVPEAMELITKTGSQEDVSCRGISNEDHESRLEQIDRISPTAICKTKQRGGDTKTASSDVLPLSSLNYRRRMPSYGWISDDDDHEEEDTRTRLVHCLKAGARVVTSMQTLGGDRKRKTRWDVKSETL